MTKPLNRLKHHVTGAIERGEKSAIEVVVKHTPGPWKVVIRDIDNQKIKKATCINDSHWVDTTSGISIADIGLSEPNARLIAAAPEMLEALKLINPVLNQEQCPFCGHPGTSSKDDNSDWEEGHGDGCELILIRAAIAKAEGKE